ncbi:hypothetical protein BpHYR1_031540 [Brachionus plicatilis]|uniref:Uncharacterized protein n=1 Tax=Brachionus plicatilis TaxID=10195 RepID=A0A3M7PXP2_BRAPC|nr:hypothetical protein BpHYR1_031540 [Brachionus plicatilis]
MTQTFHSNNSTQSRSNFTRSAASFSLGNNFTSSPSSARPTMAPNSVENKLFSDLIALTYTFIILDCKNEKFQTKNVKKDGKLKFMIKFFDLNKKIENYMNFFLNHNLDTLMSILNLSLKINIKIFEKYIDLFSMRALAIRIR